MSMIVYHGTNEEAAKRIKENGFKASKNGTFGSGVYTTTSIDKANSFAKMKSSGSKPVTLMITLNTQDIGKYPGYISTFTQNNIKQNNPYHDAHHITGRTESSNYGKPKRDEIVIKNLNKITNISKLN